MSSHAVGAFQNRCASGDLYLERARMSEDTAQGQESKSQNARGVIIFFRHRFTRIYADLSLCGILFGSRMSVGVFQNRYGKQI